MSNQNNTPTAPGWNYRRKSSPIIPIEIVLVTLWEGHLIYWSSGSGWSQLVEDDGLWLGPVPMPGEWAPMKMFNQLWAALAAKNIGRGSADYQLLQRARAWDDPEETP